MKPFYKNITLAILLILGFITNLILIDLYLVPRVEVADNITESYEIYRQSSGRYSTGHSTYLWGYKFKTEKGFEFTTETYDIQESKIYVKHTKILGNLTNIKTDNGDYSNYILSGVNGPMLYFVIILSISANVSIYFLVRKKSITENQFQNIVMFNFFLLFCISIGYKFIY